MLDTATAAICGACGDRLPAGSPPARRYCSRSCRQWRHRNPGDAVRIRRSAPAPELAHPRPLLEPELLPWLMDASARALPDDPQPLPPPPAWAADAACLGMDSALFFPARGHSTAAGLEVCDACPVRVDCGAWAIAEGFEWGTFGGLTAKVRRPLLDRRFGDDDDQAA